MFTVSARGTGYSSTAPTETQTFLCPKGYRYDGTFPGVLFLHQNLSAPRDTAPTNGVLPSLTNLLQAVGQQYPVLSADLGGNLYGNDTNLARLAEAKTYLQGAACGAKSGKVALIGISNGGVLAYNYARANPTLVSCVVQIMPVSDLQDIWSNNRGGTGTADLNAAYPATYSNATVGPTHNPESYKASLAGLRAQVWYSTDDVNILPATVLSVTTAIGSSADVHTLTGAHASDASLSQIDTGQVLRFLQQYA